MLGNLDNEVIFKKAFTKKFMGVFFLSKKKLFKGLKSCPGDGSSKNPGFLILRSQIIWSLKLKSHFSTLLIIPTLNSIDKQTYRF